MTGCQHYRQRVILSSQISAPRTILPSGAEPPLTSGVGQQGSYPQCSGIWTRPRLPHTYVTGTSFIALIRAAAAEKPRPRCKLCHRQCRVRLPSCRGSPLTCCTSCAPLAFAGEKKPADSPAPSGQCAAESRIPPRDRHGRGTPKKNFQLANQQHGSIRRKSQVRSAGHSPLLRHEVSVAQ